MQDVREQDLIGLVKHLLPLTRSITGNGVRETLQRIRMLAPVEIHEVATGTPVLDWEIPPEWNIRDAYIKDSAGHRVVDFRQSNLHVVSYSEPVDRKLSLEDLLPHLHSDPEKPKWIPYRTSYYARNWGFCLAHEQLQELADGLYEVKIDATLEPGSLSYGEICIPGETGEECLLFTHTCHPSLCNDNLSGIVICTFLARWLAGRRNHLTYRLVFAPGTIGSITWLARNESRLSQIRHGLVLGLLGDSAPLLYKQSPDGEADIDRAVEAYLSVEAPDARVTRYSPWGYDERQFGSPGFRLPVGRLTRSPEEGYPEYHTSADNLDLVSGAALLGAFEACRNIIEIIDSNRTYRNLAPKGEPQLGRRGLYRQMGGSSSPGLQQALLWVLNLSDGDHDLLEIYRRSGLNFGLLREAVRLLESVNLLEAL